MTDAAQVSEIEVLLFDLGGVLLELRDFRSNFGIETDEETFLRSWLLSPAVREFERGAIGFDEFATRAVAEMRLPYDRDEFLERFNAWPKQLFPGVPELLARLSRRYRCAVLSNTNGAHWSRWDIAQALQSGIDKAFLSYETGILKPDPASFRQVMEHYGCAAERILFFDDNPLNVEAAARLGLHAAVCRGTDGIRAALDRYDIRTGRA